QARRVLANSKIRDAVITVRSQLAEQLFRASGSQEPLSLQLRHAYGVLTPDHENVLRQAIGDGTLDRKHARRLAFNSELLTAKLADRRVEHRLTFESTLGVSPPRPEGDRRWFSQEVLPLRLEGADFSLWIGNGMELWRGATARSKEPETIDWLRDNLESTSVLYDVGANIGLYSLFAAAHPTRPTVFAFEPEPQNFARLAQNVQLNPGLSVIPFALALGVRRRFANFHSRTQTAGAASPAALQAGSGASVGVLVESLDNVVRGGAPIRPPTHLKIDVDGDEPEILRGAAETLHSAELKHVLVELRDAHVTETRDWLLASGFELAQHRDHGMDADGGRVGNFIFRKRS
ncbi:MAG TPA: FkbM family methyltransferase, partial [Polyangiaceae bacterium]|nr:FkbM family methyltransferase [Polyangiaceae bacterium]